MDNECRESFFLLGLQMWLASVIFAEMKKMEYGS